MSTPYPPLNELRGRIERACLAAGRPVSAVGLVAVSKTFDARHVRRVADAGQRAFGENYLQEALAKQSALADLDLEWHFIGTLQSNKAREAALHFDWVHGVDRLKLAQRLSSFAAARSRPLNVCIQVNISGEASKSGSAPEQVVSLCQSVHVLPGLRLRGLMAIPEPPADGGDPRAPFRQLRRSFEQARAQGLPLDTISAGMSQDLEAAIAEGATLVRVGSALFGARA